MARYRKFLVALAGLAAQALNMGLIPSPYAGWVSIVLALLTAAGVFTVRNASAAVPAQRWSPTGPTRPSGDAGHVEGLGLVWLAGALLLAAVVFGFLNYVIAGGQFHVGLG